MYNKFYGYLLNEKFCKILKNFNIKDLVINKKYIFIFLITI